MKRVKRIWLPMLYLCATVSLQAQNTKMEIRGTVTDEEGEPAISIVIRDKTADGDVYGVTDLDGNFKITADPTTSLHFSGLTYTSKVIKLKGKQRVNVVLSYESQQLNEVVVIAKKIVNKLMAEPTDIEIIGDQYIIRPRVKIPKDMFKPDSRVIVQPMLVNETRNTQRLFKPAVVTGKKYAIALERMMEFDITRDPLHPYYTKSKRVDDNEVVAYVDSLQLEYPNDQYRCDIFLYLVDYRKATYQDTVAIAKGTINPMRFFRFDISAKNMTDEKYAPRPQKQMRADKGQVNLTFLVNSAQINDSDPNNATELDKMRERLSSIDNDTNAEFHAFSITGISSPEGYYRDNMKLALRRTNVAKETILKFLNPGTVAAMRDSISVEAKVASWELVAELMEKDSVPNGRMKEILAKYPGNMDAQFLHIMRLPEYRTLIKENYLKQLRRVEYNFGYSILRILSDSEIRQMYDKDYKELTPYEFWRMYVNAETVEQKEKICREALELYPKFMLAANELAVILLNRNEPDVALLEGFINEEAPQELLCNHIIALLEKNEYASANETASLLPDNPVTADIKVITAALNGQYQVAYDYFAPQGGVNEVVLLLALKRNEEALEKAEELPDSALAYYLRATAANRVEKIVEAFAYLKRAISEEPKYRDIARTDGDVTDLLKQIDEDAEGENLHVTN